MNPALFIAGRYLFAKKTHNVINVVSAISAVGMAVGSAALIIILSIYNGFNGTVKSMLSCVEADLLVLPAEGKFFVPDSTLTNTLNSLSEVSSVHRVLQDRVYVRFADKQATAIVKGVDPSYGNDSAIDKRFNYGEYRLEMEELRFAAIGAGLAAKLGIYNSSLHALELYFPDRNARISMVNPLASINCENVWPNGEFSINVDIDNSLVLVSRDVMESLLNRKGEVSGIEIRLRSERSTDYVKKQVETLMGSDYRVLDRMQQNPSLYKMLKSEKAGVFLIMIFVIIILGFSIFGSLTMLIIDKKRDIATLRALGADKKLVRRIFTIEGWMITLGGMSLGLAVGIILSLIQEKFGIIRMPDEFLIKAYPVTLEGCDVAAAAFCIALLGYFAALIPSLRVTSRS